MWTERGGVYPPGFFPNGGREGCPRSPFRHPSPPPPSPVLPLSVPLPSRPGSGICRRPGSRPWSSTPTSAWRRSSWTSSSLPRSAPPDPLTLRLRLVPLLSVRPDAVCEENFPVQKKSLSISLKKSSMTTVYPLCFKPFSLRNVLESAFFHIQLPAKSSIISFSFSQSVFRFGRGV